MSDSFTLYYCTGCKYFLGEESFTPSMLKINSKICKTCVRRKNKIYKNENIKKLKVKQKVYCKNNKEKIKKRHQIYNKKNKEHIKQWTKIYDLKYRKNNRCIHGIHKVCPICHPTEHIASVSRCRIRAALKGNKELSSTEYIGCEYSFLRKYITDQFTGEMSWEKYMEGLIHIDHIIPIQYKEDGVTPPTLDIVIERLHYTNLQPLWAKDNIAKGNRYIG